MKTHLSAILVLVLISCSGSEPDIVKLTSGGYGSLKGEFIIDFPGKPFTYSQHFQAGQIEYDEFFYQYKVASEHIYSVSYIDYPEELFDLWDTDMLFDQSIKMFSSPLSNIRVVSRTDNNDGFEKSVTYKLTSSSPQDPTTIKAKLLIFEKRIYFISFIALRRLPENEQIDGFIDSFKIYRPKKES